MAVTLKDVAEMAGVSRSAVSRTFTEGASVSDKVRLKVMEASAILGFHPNALASSLTTGRTKLIGVVSDNFHNPIFLEVFDIITKGLQSVAYELCWSISPMRWIPQILCACCGNIQWMG